MAHIMAEQNMLYALADALQIQLEWQRSFLKVTGEGRRAIPFMDSTIEVPVKVVSSQLRSDSALIVVRFCGNLAALLISKPSKGFGVEVDCVLLNMAKMDSPVGWLEKHWPRDSNEALITLAPAIVGKFRFDKGRYVKV